MKKIITLGLLLILILISCVKQSNDINNESESNGEETIVEIEITLLSPENGESSVSLFPEFSWEINGENVQYVLYISTDKQKWEILAKNLKNNKYTPDEKLIPDTIYYWKVGIIKDGKYISESVINSFTTKPILDYKPIQDIYLSLGDELNLDMSKYIIGKDYDITNLTEYGLIEENIFKFTPENIGEYNISMKVSDKYNNEININFKIIAVKPKIIIKTDLLKEMPYNFLLEWETENIFSENIVYNVYINDKIIYNNLKEKRCYIEKLKKKRIYTIRITALENGNPKAEKIMNFVTYDKPSVEIVNETNIISIISYDFLKEKIEGFSFKIIFEGISYNNIDLSNFENNIDFKYINFDEDKKILQIDIALKSAKDNIFKFLSFEVTGKGIIKFENVQIYIHNNIFPENPIKIDVDFSSRLKLE